MGRFFQNSNSFSNLSPKTKKIFKQIGMCDYWSRCNVFVISQWICLDKVNKLTVCKFHFFKFRNHWLKTKNIEKNSEASILIKILQFLKLCWHWVFKHAMRSDVCADKHILYSITASCISVTQPTVVKILYQCYATNCCENPVSVLRNQLLWKDMPSLYRLVTINYFILHGWHTTPLAVDILLFFIF